MDKKPKITGQEAEDAVLQYLAKQNRPYNAQNIFDNLHGCVVKTSVVSILDKLASEGRLTSKEYGKAKVYLISQEHTKNLSAVEMETESENASKKRKEMDEKYDELKKKTTELSKALRIPIRFQDARSKNMQMELEITRAREIAATSNLTAELCQDVSTRFAQKEAVVRKRRRLCMDILGRMMDGTDLTLAQAYQVFGISE
eukprot:GEMP01069135.1.p1 GENE.GEMP01069135.1~~GEMP01069135.1.p1  ORF type:complete len:201 (+),score=47.66 GEMP01069135.1:29-631(+)